MLQLRGWWNLWKWKFSSSRCLSRWSKYHRKWKWQSSLRKWKWKNSHPCTKGRSGCHQRLLLVFDDLRNVFENAHKRKLSEACTCIPNLAVYAMVVGVNRVIFMRTIRWSWWPIKEKLYHKYNISRGETEVLVVTLRSLKTLMRKTLTIGKTSRRTMASATTFMAIERELNGAQDLRCGWFAKNKHIFPFFQCSETTGWKTKKVGGTTVKCKFTFEYSESGISSSSVGSEYWIFWVLNIIAFLKWRFVSWWE